MSNYQRQLVREIGFSDGAGARPMNPERVGVEDYELGYISGQKAKRDFSEQSAKSLGVTLHKIVLHENRPDSHGAMR